MEERKKIISTIRSENWLMYEQLKNLKYNPGSDTILFIKYYLKYAN